MDPITAGGLDAEVISAVRRAARAVFLAANVHYLNQTYGDSALRAFYNRADVVFCDGAGVKLAARLLGRPIPERITYADWTWRMAALAEREGFSLYLLGGHPGAAEGAAARLQKRHPGLNICGVRHGFFDHRPDSQENAAVVKEVNAADPDVLLVGFGTPLQEYWILQNRDRLNARVILAGGAVFEYVSGGLRRGPRLLTDNGFEWLARLLVEPGRLWRRYLVGNPLFLWRVLKQRAGLSGPGG